MKVLFCLYLQVVVFIELIGNMDGGVMGVGNELIFIVQDSRGRAM